MARAELQEPHPTTWTSFPKKAVSHVGDNKWERQKERAASHYSCHMLRRELILSGLYVARSARMPCSIQGWSMQI
eukprot:608140-Amphidinium_carterae.1